MGKRRRVPSRSKPRSSKKKRNVQPTHEPPSIIAKEPLGSLNSKDSSENDSEEYQLDSILRTTERTENRDTERELDLNQVSSANNPVARRSPSRKENAAKSKSPKRKSRRVNDSSEPELDNFQDDDPETMVPVVDDGSILSTWRYPSSNAIEIRRGSIEDVDIAVFRVEGSGIALGGCGWVRVLTGNASVLGGRLTPESKSFFVVSAPLAPFAVTVSAVPVKSSEITHTGAELPARENSEVDDWLKLLSGSFLKTIAKSKLKCKKEECVVLFAEPCEWKVLSSAAKFDLPHSCQFYMYRSGLPSCPEGKPAVRGMTLLDANRKVPCFTLWPEWEHVTRSVSNFIKTADNASDLRLLVCGASGTGKSVAVRCMINYLLLAETEKVVLIDTDVGQPEMNIPGLVAAHVIVRTRPGASAAWNRSVPIASRFFGNVTPREDAAFYTRCVQQVVKAGREYSLRVGCPLVVNSDGWVSDMGADLLRMVVREVAPSHVVGMSFPDATRNEVMSETLGSVRMDCGYEVKSPLAGRTSSYSGALLRDLSIATYFSETLNTGRVYEVDMEELAVEVIGESVRGEALLYLALNGCVVGIGAMCGKGKEVNVFGFGIVRGVELKQGKMYISTPLSPAELDECDKLIVSAGIQVPPALFLALADRADSRIKPPYVEANVVATGGQIRSRQNLPRKAAHGTAF